jgi:predicted ferric reductase
VVISAALIVHILNVSDTFEYAGLPRTLVISAAVGSGLLWAWIRTGRLRSARKPFRVTRIEAAGINAYRVDLEPARQFRFDSIPGQFAFVAFKTTHISGEFHPFTITSSPSQPGGIQFTIRCCGDWTNRIAAVSTQTQARIQGPFGRFSHVFFHPDHEIVMIAGGIGITPMLSMLRYMYDHEDPRRITLIWSNRTQAHMFGERELRAMQEKLTAFKWISTVWPIMSAAARPIRWAWWART